MEEISYFGKSLLNFNDIQNTIPCLLVNYRHCRCNVDIKSLCANEKQSIINIMTISGQFESSKNVNESSIGDNFTMNNQIYIKEKLYRRYLVNYYQPLFEQYLYQKIESNQQEVKLKKNNIQSQQYKKLALSIQNSYLRKVRNAFDTVNKLSQVLSGYRKSISFLENLLDFREEYLKDNYGKPKLSKSGIGVMKSAFSKIHKYSQLNKRIGKGSKILKRLYNNKFRGKLLKNFYHWKFYTSKSVKFDNQGSGII